MLYLSQLLGAPVEDPQGTRIGKITDIIVMRFTATPAEQSSILTPVSASAHLPTLVIEGQADQHWYVPAEDVEWHADSLRLRFPVEQLSTRLSVRPSAEDGFMVPISLAKDVFDKQVIDIARKEAV